MNVSIEKTRSYAYSQTKQVLKLSLGQLQSPYVASFLAIVYKEAGDYDVIENLRLWLYGYISPFIFSDPRKQTDLREKTLAIAAYIYIESNDNNPHQLPSEFVSKYIDYASKQEWYDDTLLAFICGLSSKKYTACELGANYLQDKLSLFFSQRNIAAVCQSIFFLKSTHDNQIAISSLEMVNEYISSTSIQTYEQAWALLALSRFTSDENRILLHSIKKQLEQRIEVITDPIISQAYSDICEKIIPHHNVLENKSNGENLQHTAANNSDEFREIYGLTSETIDWGELSLIAACLCLSGCSYSLSLPSYSEDKINRILLNEAKIAGGGGVVITKQANFVGNLLSILITLVFGLAGCVYLFGIEIASGSIHITSKPDLGDLLFLFVWGDYLLSQLQALFNGESALEGMVKIPLLRHIGPLLHKKGGL